MIKVEIKNPNKYVENVLEDIRDNLNNYSCCSVNSEELKNCMENAVCRIDDLLMLIKEE